MWKLRSRLARDDSGRSAVEVLLAIVFLALASLAVIRTLAGTGGEAPGQADRQVDTVSSIR